MGNVRALEKAWLANELKSNGCYPTRFNTIFGPAQLNKVAILRLGFMVSDQNNNGVLTFLKFEILLHDIVNIK